MRIRPLLLAVLLAAASACPTALAAPVPSYNGTHSGPATLFDQRTQPPHFGYDPGLAVSPAELAQSAPDAAATFTTTVAADRGATFYDGAPESTAVGFLRVLEGEAVDHRTPLATPDHDGDPVVFTRYVNGASSEFCANNQFNRNGRFVFEEGAHCADPLDGPGQEEPAEDIATLRFTVQIRQDNTYSARVDAVDGAGQVVEDYEPQGQLPYTFTGVLPGEPTTKYVPFVRLRPGALTGGPWKYQVTGSDLSTTRPMPTARIGQVNCADGPTTSVEIGNATGTATARYRVLVDGQVVRAGLLGPGGAERVPVPLTDGTMGLVQVKHGNDRTVAETRLRVHCEVEFAPTTALSTTTTPPPAVHAVAKPPDTRAELPGQAPWVSVAMLAFLAVIALVVLHLWHRTRRSVSSAAARSHRC
ncbi:hypothetical protein [Allokutzneria sp. NRRL B-24872]|uniref:hypothetical protein n=1 Tax=Allokutzneria sp. NRRL B-24872 TaxID=1137961 RepID=UPI000A3CE6C4|nr:hypothetical protein [Allokutzneria sp. NRRL B-24872]